MSGTTVDEIRDKLVRLATSGAMAEIEDAWLEAIEQAPADLAPFLETARILNRGGERERSSLLLLTLYDEIAERADPRDCLTILRIVAENKPSDPEVRAKVLDCVRRAHREQPAMGALLEKSGLDGGARIPDALAIFEEFTRLRPGCHVFHPTGWGTGRVTRVDGRTGELTVDFEVDKGHRIPIDSAREIFRILDDDDLRAYKFSRLEEIRVMAGTDPAAVLRLVLRGRKGKARSTEIRNDLRGSVVPMGEWSKWWTKAKREAARDPLIELREGSKPVLVLRDRPVDVGDEALDAVRAAPSLAEAVAQARSILRSIRESVDVEALVDAVRERLGDADRLGGDAPTGAVLEALLFLSEPRGRSARREGVPLPAPAAFLRERLRHAIGTGLSAGEAAAAARGILADIRIHEFRNRFLDLVREVFPGGWHDLYSDLLRSEGSDLWDHGCAHLREAGHEDLVLSMTREMTVDPDRHPEAFLAFARGLLHGRYRDLEGVPDRQEVVLRLLHLYEGLHRRSAIADPASLKKLLHRIESLLLDPKHRHLDAALRSLTLGELDRILHESEASPYLSDEIKSAVRTTVARTHPELLTARQGPFWLDGNLYCTAEAIQRKRREFRHLTEVKIPENSRAVGDAAALGDLSENSEYTAALEAQRHLTAKAEELRAALDRARAIEGQVAPEGIAAPGTRLRLRREGSETLLEYRLLGPWDAGVEEDVISYLSPLGQAVLGRSLGDVVLAELPDGAVRFNIAGVERLF